MIFKKIYRLLWIWPMSCNLMLFFGSWRRWVFIEKGFESCADWERLGIEFVEMWLVEMLRNNC